MNLEIEAKILGRYIIKENINDIAISRYIQGIEKLGYVQDNALVIKAIETPFLLPYIDAGLALTNKKHLLQKKLLLMFSVLETMPEYSSKFLSRSHSFFYLFVFFWIGTKGVIKALLGTILNKMLGRK